MKRVTLLIMLCAGLLAAGERVTAQIKTSQTYNKTSQAYNYAQRGAPKHIQGTISVSDDKLLQQLQQAWGGRSLAQAAGNQLRAEVWQVLYVRDKDDPTYTNILLCQPVASQIAYNAVQGGVGFDLTFNPLPGNLAVVVYAPIPPNLQAHLKGKPNDGRPASIGHLFRSDAKNHIGKNMTYGIYSIPMQNAVTGADFRISAGAKPNCHNCDAFSDFADGVEDVANDVFNFAKAKLTGAADAIGKIGESIVVDNGILLVQCAGVITTFLQTGKLPAVKMMTDYMPAYNMANSTVFMSNLPPPDKIIVTNLMSIDRRPFTVPVKLADGVYILMNLGDAYDDPLNHPFNGFTGDVFIHELVHAWQIWNNDQLKLFVDGAVNQFKNTVISNQYSYGCDGHNINDQYNEEQQAMIVERFYSILFYSQDGVFDANHNHLDCGFEQQWTVNHIMGGNPKAYACFEATRQIYQLARDKATANYTGGLPDRVLASPSNGNRFDGAGWFLPGRANNSFYYYSDKTKVVSADWGPIRDKYIKFGYEFGKLGWPERNELLLPDGVGYYQKFNHGFVYYHPNHGTWAIPDNIFDTWKDTGWEQGKLGYPLSDYNAMGPNRGYQMFEKGIITYDQPDTKVINHLVNYTNVTYGDPQQLASAFRVEKTKVSNVNPDYMRSAINPQPLPPRTTKQTVQTVRRQQ